MMQPWHHVFAVARDRLARIAERIGSRHRQDADVLDVDELLEGEHGLMKLVVVAALISNGHVRVKGDREAFLRKVAAMRADTHEEKVTARWKAEQARLAAMGVIDRCPEIQWMANEEGTQAYVNKADLDSDDPYAAEIFDTVCERAAELLDCALTEMVVRERSWTVDGAEEHILVFAERGRVELLGREVEA